MEAHIQASHTKVGPHKQPIGLQHERGFQCYLVGNKPGKADSALAGEVKIGEGIDAEVDKGPKRFLRGEVIASENPEIRVEFVVDYRVSNLVRSA
jgi:hypothetical protein